MTALHEEAARRNRDYPQQRNKKPRQVRISPAVVFFAALSRRLRPAVVKEPEASAFCRIYARF